jgi:tetratricopeptide (TPR) repeat protein
VSATKDLGKGAALERELEALRGAFKDDRKRPAWSAAFGVAVLVAVALGAVGWLGLERDRREGTALVYDEGFATSEALEGQNWISEALSQTIAAHLSAGEGARIVNTAETGSFESLSIPAERARAATGASWLLGGTVAPAPGVDGQIILTLTLTDLQSESAPREAALSGSPDAIGDLAARASLQLLAWLDRAPLTSEQLRQASADLPFDSAAGRAYAEAIAALDRRDGRAANAHLDAAERDAPNHPAIHDARARAWDLLGYRDRAAAAARRAFELSGDLSPARRLSIEARYRETVDQWSAAIENWRALRAFYPDDVGYGLSLARAQTSADDFDAAHATIAALRELGPPSSADPRIDLLESDVFYRAGNYADSAAAAVRAADAARALGARAVLAEAQLSAVTADADDKRERLEEAGRLYNELDIPRGQVVVLKELGDLAFYDGDLPGAADLYRQSIALARRSGNEPQQAASENSLAIAYDLMGRLEDGYELKRRVAAYYEARGVRSRHSIMLENIGISLFKLGRYDEALESFDAALVIFEEIGDEIGIAWAPYHRGRIAIRQGDLAGGRALIEQAIANAAEHPEGNLEVNARFELMLGATFAGDYIQALAQARDLLEEYRELDLDLDAAETSIYVARSAAALGEFDTARSALDDALALLDQAQEGYYAAEALTAFVDLALVAARPEAPEACRTLASIADRQEHAIVRLRAETRLIACDVWVFGAPPERSEARLAAVAAEADALGLFEPAFDALETRAHVLARLDRRPEAEAVLADLSVRAERSGWRNASSSCLEEPPGNRCVAAAAGIDP